MPQKEPQGLLQVPVLQERSVPGSPLPEQLEPQGLLQALEPQVLDWQMRQVLLQEPE